MFPEGMQKKKKRKTAPVHFFAKLWVKVVLLFTDNAEATHRLEK